MLDLGRSIFIFTRLLKNKCMRLILVVIFFHFLSILTLAQESYSIQRDDNDFATYQDIHSNRVNNPKKISAVFNRIIKTKKAELNNPLVYSYRIVVSPKIDIYALTISSFMERKLYLILHDKIKNEVSNTPIVIDLKWAFNNEAGSSFKLLNYPLLSVSNENEMVIISVRERVHNGNVYNAVLNKQYLLKDDPLSLQLLFCYEESSVLPDGKVVHRILDGTKFINVILDEQTATRSIGRIEIDTKKRVIVERLCELDELCDVLFTTSGMPDEQLFKTGVVAIY